MTSKDTTEPDGTPVGMLMWGQAGTYNAVDDREVIAAIADAGVGIVHGASVMASTGLTFDVAGPWLGIASCSDGTRAVVGSRVTHKVTVAAGPSSGSRQDVIWVDTYPDEGVWRMHVVPVGSQLTGRTGMSLARITAPAGANLAAQMSVDHAVPTYGAQTDTMKRSNPTNSLNTLTPHYKIAPWTENTGAVHIVRAFGTASTSSATGRDTLWRCAAPGSPVLRLGTGGGVMKGGTFMWEGEVTLWIHDPVKGIGTITVRVMCSALNDINGSVITKTGVCTRTNISYGGGDPNSWETLELQGAFTEIDNGNQISCQDSVYQVIQPSYLTVTTGGG